MPGGVIAEAFVQVSADLDHFEADVKSGVDRPLEHTEDVAKEAARGISTAFKRSADDLQREFGMSADAAARALEILDGKAFTELRAEAQRTGEVIDSSFQENANQAGTQLEQLDSKTFSELRADSERTGEKIERDFAEAGRSADRSLDGIEKSGHGHFGALALAATGALAVIGGMGILAVKQGLQTAGGLEMSTTAFEGVLGSAEAAKAEMAKLTDFAAKTPLELPGLLKMDSQLLAVHDALGLTQDQVLPFISTVGDLASGLGQGQPQMDAVVTAMTQMGSSGRVSAQDMNQLTNALPGFPVWKVLAEGMGLTVGEVRKLAEEGKITAEQAIPVLIDGMKKFPGAAGAMERSSQTLTGQLSTFKDTANIALAEGLKPLVEGIKTQLPQLTAAIGPLFGGVGIAAAAIFDKLAPQLQSAIGPISDVIGKLGEPIGNIITVLGATIQPVLQSLAPVAEALGGAFKILEEPMANLGGAIGDALAEVFRAIAPLLPIVARALGKIADALLPIIAPVSKLVGLLGDALTPVIETLVTTIADIVAQFVLGMGPALDQVLAAVTPLIPVLMDLSLSILKPLQPVLPDLALALGQLAGAVAQLLIAILPLILPIVKFQIFVQTMVGGLLAQLAPLIVILADALAKVVLWIAQVLPSTAQLQAAWQALLSWFQGAWVFIYDYIVTPIQTALATLGTIVAPLWQAVQVVFDAALAWATAVWSMINELLVAPIRAGLEALAGLVGPGWAVVQAVFEAAIGWVSGTWATINESLVQPVRAGVEVLAGIVTAGWAGAQTALQSALNFVNGAWKAIESALSAPVIAGVAAITAAVSGMWEGIRSVLNTVISGINGLIRGWNNLSFTFPSIDVPGWGGVEVMGQTVIPGWGGMSVGGQSFGTPNISEIPGLATGGLVTRAGLAMLHPAEVVVPAPGVGGVTFNGPVTFAGDPKENVDELSWFVRFRMKAA